MSADREELADIIARNWQADSDEIADEILARWQLVPLPLEGFPQRIVILDREWHTVAPGVQVRYADGFDEH